MLTGYKTYIAALVAILTAVGTYLSGEIELGALLQIVSTAIIGVFIRQGVKKDTGAAA